MDVIKGLIFKLVKIIDNFPPEFEPLNTGKTGLSYMKLYLGKCFDLEQYSADGLLLLEEVINNLNTPQSQINTLNFYDGLSGVLSVMSNLNASGLVDIDFDDFKIFDSLLIDHVEKGIDEDNFDFFYGSMGALSYLVSRLPDEELLPAVQKIILKLCSKISGSSQPFLLVSKHTDRINDVISYHANLSLAHGMSSTILNLITYLSKDEDNLVVRKTISGCINQIITLNQQKSSAKVYEKFIYSIHQDTGEPSYYPRIGWCAGDLNMLHVLYSGSIALEEEAWSAFADDRAERVMNRISINETLVYDPFLCHGSMGIYHYYKHLYDLTGKPGFKNASEIWLDKGIGFLSDIDESFFFSPEYKKTGHVHSFFYGVPGLVLPLISAYDPTLVHWSKLILL